MKCLNRECFKSGPVVANTSQINSNEILFNQNLAYMLGVFIEYLDPMGPGIVIYLAETKHRFIEDLT